MSSRNPFLANQVHSNGSGFVDSLLGKLSIVSRIDNSKMTVNENFQIDIFYDLDEDGVRFGLTALYNHAATMPKLCRDLGYVDYSDDKRGFDRKIVYAVLEGLVSTACYIEYCEGKFVDKSQYDKSLHKNITQLDAFILAIWCKGRDVVSLGNALDGRPLGILSQHNFMTIIRPAIYATAKSFGVLDDVIDKMFAQWDDTNFVYNNSFGYLSVMNLLKNHMPDFIFEPHDVSDLTTGVLDSGLGMISENVLDFPEAAQVKTVFLDTDVKPSVFDIALNCVFSANISVDNKNLYVASNFIFSTYTTPLKLSQYQSEILYVMFGVKSANLKLNVHEEMPDVAFLNPKYRPSLDVNSKNTNNSSNRNKASKKFNANETKNSVEDLALSMLDNKMTSAEKKQAIIDSAVLAMDQVKRTGTEVLIRNVLPAVLAKISGPLIRRASQYGVGINFNDANNGIRIGPIMKILPGG